MQWCLIKVMVEKIIARVMLFCSFLLVSCASVDTLKQEDVAEYEKISKTSIPIVVNAEVEKFTHFFQTAHRKHFTKWLERSHAYLPMMKEVFKQEGLPEDLAYLALIESGYNPYAYSRARATGIWQFMRATGKRYNLNSDWWIEERRDPVKSTHAAARYLRDLYKIFGSWYLAVAAYNAGEGKILRSVRKYKTDNFWTMSKYSYLRRETKDYIPKFIAAMIIAKDPEKYGFNNLNYLPPYEYDEVNFEKPVDLHQVAEAIEMDVETLKQLNPELRKWCTPLNLNSYKLKVPKDKQELLALQKPLIPTLSRMDFLNHRVRYGDTLWKIAHAYDTPVDIIKKVNSLRTNAIRVGSTLMIPVEPGTKSKPVRINRTAKVEPAPETKDSQFPDRKKVIYTVDEGDTLWNISRNFNISVKDIIAWNDLENSRIHPGDQIHLYLKD